MRIVHWNVNGIRAAHAKGLQAFVEAERPDILCLQEVRATPAQYDTGWMEALGYHAVWHPAEKPGYSGVATFSLDTPVDITPGLGDAQFDREGRLLVTRHGDITVLNGYFPNAQRELTRLDYKASFYTSLLASCQRRREAGEKIVIGGDWNTAHTPADIKNWRANQKASGFTVQERALLDDWVAAGFIDVWRRLNPEATDVYTWWSNRPGIREKNVGWRIDFQCVSPELWPQVRGARIRCEVMGADHCPVELTLAP